MLLLFINCQKEDFTTVQEQEKATKTLYKQRTVSLSEIPKIKQKVIEKLNPEVFNRTEDSTSNQAIFETENILEIIDTLNNANYSFQFRFPDTPISTFYNLVVGETPNGDVITPFVMKYKCDDAYLDQYIANGLDFQYFVGTMSIHKYTDFFALGEFDRTETQCPPEYDEVGDPISCSEDPVDGGGDCCNNGNNIPGDGYNGGSSNDTVTCTFEVYVTDCGASNSDIMHLIGTCGGNTSTATKHYIWNCDDNQNPTSPALNEEIARTTTNDCPSCSSPDGGVGINSNLIITARAVLKHNLDLSPEAIAWIGDDSNVDLVIDTYNYLVANTSPINGNYLGFAISFAQEAIEAMLDGIEVYFSEGYIQMDSPDDSYVEINEKSLIPNPLVLENGDEINIEFGETNDGVNANQEIRNHTIEGLKFALNEANNNLSSSEKITGIYLMATTNGVHSSTSNHSKASAIDISRINGIKMKVSGVTEQIIKLQEALDNFEYIRENFGPYFKHKYSIESNTWNYNYPIGGHKDHIHMATRIN